VRIIAGCLCMCRIGDRGERLAEGVSPLADWPAVACHVEKHASVGVETMPFDELQAAAAPLKPFGPRLDRVVHRQQHPGHAALHSDRLVAIDQRAVTVDAVKKTAVLGVYAAWKPKTHRIVQETVAIAREQLSPALFGY